MNDERNVHTRWVLLLCRVCVAPVSCLRVGRSCRARVALVSLLGARFPGIVRFRGRFVQFIPIIWIYLRRETRRTTYHAAVLQRARLCADGDNGGSAVVAWPDVQAWGCSSNGRALA